MLNTTLLRNLHFPHFVVQISTCTIRAVLAPLRISTSGPRQGRIMGVSQYAPSGTVRTQMEYTLTNGLSVAFAGDGQV